MSEISRKRDIAEATRDEIRSLVCELDIENDKEEAKVGELLTKIARKRETIKAICCECGDPIFASDVVHYVETSKWGYERPFCDFCTLICDDPRCDAQIHCRETAWRHENCQRRDSESSESEEDSAAKAENKQT